MSSLGRNLREQVQKVGVSTTVQALREGIREKKIRREDFSLRETAQAFLGDNWYGRLEEYRGQTAGRGVALRESETAVDASNFTSISGQLLVDVVREKYELATKVGNEMFSVQPITNGNLGPHTEPGLRRVKDKPKKVNAGQPYPHAFFDGDAVTYPAPNKYGEICNVTMEMIFADLTGQAIESAESVGDIVGLGEEYEKLAVALMLAGGTFAWNGTTYNLYAATAAVTGGWANRLTDFTLTDWRSMNRVEQLFAQMMDPATGKPIRIDVKDMLVMPAARYNAKRVLNATEVREGDITTGGGTQTVGANPLESDYRILSSPHARNLCINGEEDIVAAGSFTAAVTDTMILVGDFKKAFVYRQVYPMKTTQAPPLNPLEFNQDIVLSVKGSRYGVACVKDPRYVAQCYNSSAS